MKISLASSGLKLGALILTPECHGDELQIEKLITAADELGIDCHAWSNERGAGLTFWTRDRDAGQ